MSFQLQVFWSLMLFIWLAVPNASLFQALIYLHNFSRCPFYLHSFLLNLVPTDFGGCLLIFGLEQHFKEASLQNPGGKNKLDYFARWRRKSQILFVFKVVENCLSGTQSCRWFAYYNLEAFCAADVNATWAIYVHLLPASQAFYCQHHCWQMTLKVTHCIFMICKSLYKVILLPFNPIKLLDSVQGRQAALSH